MKDIVAYVKTNFGVLYTVGGMTGWLRSAGFSYKKPAVVPGSIRSVGCLFSAAEILQEIGCQCDAKINCFEPVPSG